MVNLGAWVIGLINVCHVMSMEAPSDNDFTTLNLDWMLGGFDLHQDISEECLNLNTFPSETVNLDPGDHPLEYPWVNFKGNRSQRTYSKNCPYRKGEIKDGEFFVHKKFRLIEEFPGDLVYTGDSYGHRSYIDANEERTCPQSCLCRSHGQAPSAFTFVARKSPSQLVVNFLSDALYSEVIQAVALEKEVQMNNFIQEDRWKSLNAFYLLRSFQALQNRLDVLRHYATINQSLCAVTTEMELLIYGFLADGEVFKSFGYEHLYENGFLSFEQWKAFQQDQLQRDISTLNEQVIAIDDIEGVEDFSVPENPTPLLGILSDNFQAAEAHSDSIPTVYTQILQPVIGKTSFAQGYPNLEPRPFPRLSSSEDFLTAREDTQSLCINKFDTVDDQNRHKSGPFTIIRRVTDRLSFGIGLGATEYTKNETGETLNFSGDLESSLILAAITGDIARVSQILDYNNGTHYHSGKKILYVNEQPIKGPDQRLLEYYYLPKFCKSTTWKFQNEVHPLRPWLCNKTYLDLFIKAARRFPHDLLGATIYDIAVIEAAAAGHEEIVKTLLDHGASVNGANMVYEDNNELINRQKIPVVEAAKAGHGAVVRLLLQRGAVVSSLEPLMPLSIKKEEDQTFRQLNKKFIQEHQLMTDATSDHSADFLQLGTRFKNHRETWNAGITTMRRLCSGRPPRGLQNAIAFLCISKAMAETLDSLNGSDYKRQFLEDLERWQIMFTPEELGWYQAWVHSMWGVSLSESKQSSWKASDFLTLTHFQTLLSTLIRQDNERPNICGSHDQSLISSQQKFIARNRQRLAEPDVDFSTENLDSPNGNLQPTNNIEPKPPDIPIVPDKVPLKERIDDDISTASVNATVILLMAGAIFIIVIIFFQWLRGLFAALLPSVEIHDLQSRCQVLAIYLGLKAYFAKPFSLPLTSTYTVGSIKFPTNTDYLQQTTKLSTDIDSFEESPQSLFIDHGDQSMINPNDSISIQQENISSPCTIAVNRAAPSNYDAAISSTDSSQESPSSQQSILTPNKIPQKPRSKCPTCKKKILTTNLKRHLKDHTGENKVGCRFCGKLIGRKEYLKRHERDRCPLRHTSRQN